MHRNQAPAARPRRAALWVALALLPLAAGLAAICVGRYSITPAQVLQTFSARLHGQPLQQQYEKIVWTMRLPRAVLALLVGGGLSAAGVAFQSLFSNPLATPDTLGVASGASLGAVVGLYFGVNLLAMQAMALAAGFLAVGLTFLTGCRRNGRGSLTTVVLAGMVISSLFSALVSLFKYIADPDSKLPAITYWLMGGLSSASWQGLRLGAPFLLLGSAVLLVLRWRLNILPLSDDEARATGTHLGLLRGVVALCATMITASAVAMCGQVAWIGLLVPHICRMLFGSDNSRLLPASLCIGAAFLLVVDTLARCITAGEIPVSILTACIGAPFFIQLLRQTRGWES